MDKHAISTWLSGLSGAHALQFDRDAQRTDFLATLLRSPCARTWWAIPADGGLLTDYELLENVLLPARVKGDDNAAGRLRRLLRRLQDCGIDTIPLGLPLAALSPWQARIAAFLRATVADAPALVFDDTCYGLGKTECRQAILLHRFFRNYFPFRPTVYIALSPPHPELNIAPGNCHHHETVFA